MCYDSWNCLLQDHIVFFFCPKWKYNISPKLILLLNSQLMTKASQERDVCLCVCCLWEELDLSLKTITINHPRNEGCFLLMKEVFFLISFFPVAVNKMQQLTMSSCWSLHIIVTFCRTAQQKLLCVLFIQCLLLFVLWMCACVCMWAQQCVGVFLLLIIQSVVCKPLWGSPVGFACICDLLIWVSFSGVPFWTVVHLCSPSLYLSFPPPLLSLSLASQFLLSL